MRQRKSSWLCGAQITVGASIIFLLTVGIALAAAQTPAADAAPESLPRVAVAEIDANPGQSLMIPMYFTPDPKTPLRSFTAEIDFVSNNLKFKSAESASDDPAQGINVTASLAEGKPDDKGVTRSTIRVTASSRSKQGLPDGLAAYLLFQLSTEAKAFAIKLNTNVIAAEDTQNPPQKVSHVSTKSGLVVVALADTNPEANCFFFTH